MGRVLISVYVIQSTYNRFVSNGGFDDSRGSRWKFTKIGYSGNVKQRFDTIRTHNPLDTELMLASGYPDESLARIAEEILHQKFAGDRCGGEWFMDILNTRAEFNSVINDLDTMWDDVQPVHWCVGYKDNYYG